MLRLSTKIKLPLSEIKGSYKERFELARALNSKFFKKISSEFKTKDVSPDIFEKHLAEVSSHRINFGIEDSTELPFTAKTLLFQNKDDETLVDKFKIVLPLNRFDKTISLNDTNIFMHEFFHFFCEIVNPKHIKRTLTMTENGLFNSTNDFYNKYLYSKSSSEELKKVLPDFLETLKPEDRINFLQNSRYRLKEELEAYKEGYKYYDKIQDEHLDLISEKFSCDDGAEYNFQHKINILNDVLKKQLASLRNQ